MDLRTQRLWALAVGLSTLFVASAVSAQAWLADRDRGQGAGIRVGDVELHPGLGFEAGYDSNVLLANSENASALRPGPIGSYMLRLTPQFAISTLTAERRGQGDNAGHPSALSFRGGFWASFFHYGTSAAQDNVFGDANLNLTIMPERPFQLILNEEFSRNSYPFTPTVPGQKVSYGQNFNDASVTALWSTPGHLLELKLQYLFEIGFFDNAAFQFANYYEHTPSLGLSWRFLPQSALIYKLAVDYLSYPNAAESTTSLVSDATRVTTMVGFNGAITRKVSATLLAGYTAGFFKVGDNYQDFAGQAQVRWQLTQVDRVSLGYSRQTFPSFIGNFYRNDLFTLDGQTLLFRRLFVDLTLSAGLVSFGTPVRADNPTIALGTNADGSPSRHDVRLIGQLFTEYRFADWLGVNATLRYVADLTGYRYLNADLPSGFDAVNYKKFQAFLGVRAMF